MVNPDGKLWIEKAAVGRRFTRRAPRRRRGRAHHPPRRRACAARGHRQVSDRLGRAAGDRRALRGRDAAGGGGTVLFRAQTRRRALPPRRLRFRAHHVGRPGQGARPRGGRAQEHPRRGRHLLGQDHAGQRPAGRGRRASTSASSSWRTRASSSAPPPTAWRCAPSRAWRSLADLVRSTLRLRPDRIVVGEVRGPEALDMLKAWNTGHPGGITTVHANSAAAGLYRLEQLVQEAVVTVPRNLIVEAIDIVVFLSGPRSRPARRDAAGGHGLDADGEYVLQPARPPGPPSRVTGARKPNAAPSPPARSRRATCRRACSPPSSP